VGSAPGATPLAWLIARNTSLVGTRVLLSRLHQPLLKNESQKICADSRLLFLAEFLESGIGAQRVPEWIEP
jgi:hypothetical protein